MITLLNGEQWEQEALLEKMYDDDFYYGHLGKHALSSSSIKTIIKSPKTYRNVIKYGSDTASESPALIAGKIFHWMILEPHKIDELKFVDASTRNTKIYKEAKEEHGEVYLTKEKHASERLADALFRNEAALELLNKAEFEVPAIEMMEGIAIRGKADILKDNEIIDIKTSQDLNTFRYSADKYGYDLQAWLYCQLFNVEKFTFLVIDKGSCDIAIFETSEEFLEKGRNKFHQGIDNYKYFFEQDHDLDQYVMRGML